MVTWPARTGSVRQDPRLRRWARQTVIASFDGPEAPDWLLRELHQGLGGVVLFASNVRDPAQVASLCATMSDAGDPLLCIDEEGGEITRLHWMQGSPSPGQAALGVVDDLELTEAVSREVGQEVRAAGLTLNLAPVADVCAPAGSPAIGTRSFASDAELVARHTAAAVRGMHSAGVGVCLKHWPGHGSARSDTHLANGHLLQSAEEWAQQSLPPFVAGIAAGADAVMTGHLQWDEFGPEPATFSPRAVDHLRQRLGFEGVIISDALDMGGTGRSLSVGVADALVAGVDALCLGARGDEATVDRAVRAVLHAVEEGRLHPERLEQAAGRMSGTARRLAAQAGDPAPVTSGCSARAASAALRVLIAPETAVVTPLLLLDLTGEPLRAADDARWHARDAVLERWPTSTLVLGDPDAPGSWPRPSRVGGSLVILARGLACSPAQRAAVAWLQQVHRSTILVETGWLGQDRWSDSGVDRIFSFGSGPANIRAVVGHLSRLERQEEHDARQ